MSNLAVARPMLSGSRPAARARLAGLALSALTAAACTWTAASNPPKPVPVAPPRGPVQVAPPLPPAGQAQPIATASLRIRVTDSRGTRIVSIPIDEYVAGCVRAELDPATTRSPAAINIMSVQAIVSRTYALANRGRHAGEGFDLCDSTHCQLYRASAPGSPADEAARAVAATAGQIITFGGKPIQALFHSNCGGHTADAEDVWGGPAVPYLTPVDDRFCLTAPGAHWEFAVPARRLRDVLNGDTRTAVGSRLDRIDVPERDTAGRAIIVAAVGERSPIVRAEEFRAVISQAFGPRSLKSTWFTVTRREDQFVFSGVGYGHGVGLCQAGAALRAQAGQSADVIIGHYFPGTRLLAARSEPAAGVPGSIHP